MSKCEKCSGLLVLEDYIDDLNNLKVCGIKCINCGVVIFKVPGSSYIRKGAGTHWRSAQPRRKTFKTGIETTEGNESYFRRKSIK